jgi:hypothetical protein
LTDVCFFVGSKIDSVAFPKLIWCKNEKNIAQEALLDLRKMVLNNQQAVEKTDYCVYFTSQFPTNADDWKIISQRSNIFKQKLDRFVSAEKLCRISNIFTINQGALTGIKGVFKISKEDYFSLPENEKKYFRPVIDNKSIKCGQLKTSEFIWFPYNETEIMLKNEEELKSISFANNKLFPNKEKLTQRKGVKEWWGLTRPRNWQFKKGVRLYSNRFGNSDSFAIDKNGNCIVEEGNAFIPLKKIDHDDYYFYLSVFSSEIFDYLLSIFSKQLAGGIWYDLGAKHTKNIPIPDVHLRDAKESDSYYRLVKLGKELENGNPYMKHAIRDAIEIYYPNI